MFARDNDFDIVSRSLSGLRQVDEATQASLAALAERLESLKNTSSLFDGVCFSKDAEKLASQVVMG